MLDNEDKDPFWLQPPWIILTDTLKLKRINLWNIEIDYLIKGFLEKMLLMDLVNFRVSGLALFSASLLYRWKTETLLRTDDETDSEKETVNEEFKLLPPIIPPFRQTARRISMGELLVALDKALKEETKIKRRSLITKNIMNEIQPLVFAIDPDKSQIERTLTTIYETIKDKSKINSTLRFSELLTDKTKMGIVKTFFCILLLGFRGYIDVWQETDFGDIFIELLKDEGEISLGEILGGSES